MQRRSAHVNYGMDRKSFYLMQMTKPVRLVQLLNVFAE